MKPSAPFRFLHRVLVSAILVAACLDMPVPGAMAAATGTAGGGNLDLTIVEAATGRPVPFARLDRTDAPGVYLAAGDGVVRLRNVSAGTWTVRASHIVFGESEDLQLEISPGGTTEFRAELAPAVSAPPGRPMETIEVRAEAGSRNLRAAAGVRTIVKSDVEALPNPSDDVFQMVRLLPGVSSDETGAEFHIRGGNTNETLLRVDGLELRQLFHGRDYGGITSIVPMSMVRGVDVYPGAFPARYGGKLSGVVDLKLRERADEGWHGRFGADIVSTRLFATHGGKSATWMVSAREGYLDRVLRTFRDGFDARSGYRDLFVRGLVQPIPGARTSVNYLRSEDHIFYDEGIDAHQVNSDYLDHYVWSTTTFDGHGWSADGTVHWARSDQRRVVGGDNRDDQNLDRYGIRLEATAFPGGGHAVTLGGQIDRETGFYRYRSDEVIAVAADGTVRTLSDLTEEGRVDQSRASFFLQDEWRPLRSLALNGGLRAARSSGTRRLRYSPRATAAWTQGTWTLKAGGGVFEQPPSAAIDLEEDVQLRSRRRNRALHRVVGAEKRFGPTRVGLDLWDKDFTALDGIITQATPDGVTRYVIREGHSRGAEIFVNRTTGDVNWWLSYTLGRTEWGGEDVRFSRDFDRLHALTLSNTFTLSERWDLGLSYSYHSGTPYTRQSWSRDDVSRQWVLEEDAPNSSRLPAYQRLDVRVRRHFTFDGWQMAVYAEGMNLTNHENVLWYAWRFRDTEGGREPERVTRTGLPGIPSIGVEIRF